VPALAARLPLLPRGWLLPTEAFTPPPPYRSPLPAAVRGPVVRLHRSGPVWEPPAGQWIWQRPVHGECFHIFLGKGRSWFWLSGGLLNVFFSAQHLICSDKCLACFLHHPHHFSFTTFLPFCVIFSLFHSFIIIIAASPHWCHVRFLLRTEILQHISTTAQNLVSASSSTHASAHTALKMLETWLFHSSLIHFCE